MARGIETKCLHLEEEDVDGCKHYGALSYPIYQTATFAHLGVGKSTGYDYSRLQNPTREHLEKVVATLENGITFSRIDFHKEDVESYIKENTRAVYIETPTNPMMNVTDIAALSKIAKKHGLLLIVDNTFLSPYFQNPLELGADIVVHSGTKYLGGHNDTLAGFLVTNREDISEKLRFLIKTTGAGLAPFDSWLILRGIKTLGIRMEKAQKNAMEIAKWLKTLITYPTTQTHADVPQEIRERNGITEATLRLSVGIEDIKDLLEELETVFKEIEGELHG